MEEVNRQEIGQRLRQARKDARLSQLDVAKELGLAVPQTVSHWECGRSMPKLGEWHALGLLYGTSLDYLVYGIRTVLVSKGNILKRIFGGAATAPDSGFASSQY